MSIAKCNVTVNSSGEEVQKHGTSEFPIAFYEENLSSYSIPWHWHEDFEIIWVISGSIKVSVNSTEHILNKNQGIFINAGFLHSIHATNDGEYVLRSIVFHPRLIGSIDSIYWQNYIEPIIQNKNLPYILLDPFINWQDKILAYSISVWNRLYNTENGFEIYVRNELSQLILIVLTNHSICEAKPSIRNLRNADRIKTMLQYIQMHFSETITISTLASVALISESEVLRCFHRTIHSTPNQYLKQYRIQKACQMLIDTDMTSIDIAFQCGFQSSSYFTKTFREQIGCTPLEYRKRDQQC